MNVNSVCKAIDVTLKVTVAASLAAKAVLVAVLVKKAASFEKLKDIAATAVATETETPNQEEHA